MSLILLLIMNKILLIQMGKTYCLGGRHLSNTNNLVEYEKVNPRTEKIVKFLKENVALVVVIIYKFLLNK